MTGPEIEKLIHTMAVYWPKANVEATTIALWQQNLAKIRRPELAEEAVSILMETTPFWPHWSEFKKVLQELLAAERRDSQAVFTLPAAEPMQADQSTNVFRALHKIMTQGPAATAAEAELLIDCLAEQWGDFDDSNAWLRKFRRMEFDTLSESVAAAIDRWGKCPGWSPFGRLYLEHTDRRSLQMFQAVTA